MQDKVPPPHDKRKRLLILFDILSLPAPLLHLKVLMTGQVNKFIDDGFTITFLTLRVLSAGQEPQVGSQNVRPTVSNAGIKISTRAMHPEFTLLSLD